MVSSSSVQIVRLEFQHYDYHSSGTISSVDFALSMVASADINHVSKFLDRVDELNSNVLLKEMRISFEVRHSTSGFLMSSIC